MLAWPKRIILSRKGFDSAAGGCASPILDGKLISLPIPEPDCSAVPCTAGHVTYAQLGDLRSATRVSELVSSLTRGKVSMDRCVHLDPDIRPELRRPHHRKQSGEAMLFGQVGSAQSELRSVEAGDLFLFFGWFREAQRTKTGFQFRSGAPDEHHLWGWLQVADCISVGDPLSNSKITLQHKHHPHVSHAHTRSNNMLYKAREALSFLPELPGAGLFPCATWRTRLTATTARSRSQWVLPSFFCDVGLTRFKFSPEFWQEDGNTVRSIAPRCKGCGAASYGQEFVSEITARKQKAHAWLRTLFRNISVT